MRKLPKAKKQGGEVAQELEVDHGFAVSLSVYCPDPGSGWPCPVIPLLVNVIQCPQPAAARCLALGEAIGRAVRSCPEDLKVAIFGTGGMSHQLAGERAGLINTSFDKMFLEKIQTDPRGWQHSVEKITCGKPVPRALR